MKKLLIALVLVLPFIGLQAQKKSIIAEKRVSSCVEKVIEYDNGLNEERIVEETYFDENGRVIEYKDWDKDGKLKQWIKYIYNADGSVNTEVTFNDKGKTLEKIRYEYQNGLKVKKSYWDSKDRLVKEKKYEYSYR